MKRIGKSRIISVALAAVLAVSLGVLAAVLWRGQDLETRRDAVIQEMLALEGEYRESSLILRDVDRNMAESLALRLGGTLRATGDGSFFAVTLPEGVTVKDVYTDPDNRDILLHTSLDRRLYAFDAGDTPKGESAEEDGTEEDPEEGLHFPNYVVTEPDYVFQDYLRYLNVGDVWHTTMGKDPSGKKIRIAVIDSGIDTDHPEFRNQNGQSIISNASYNATKDQVVLLNGNDFSLIEDENGHGTAVAGVIAAQINGLGTVGLCPDVELVVIKCEMDEEGAFSESDVTFALYYAIERNAAVINTSFGSPDIDPNNSVREIVKAVNLAVDSDIVIVASAGNEGKDGPVFPACHELVVGVGALEADSWELAAYSNYGVDNVDVVAPGTVYTSVMGGGYSSQSGTSMATPMVASAVALYKTLDPYVTCETVLKHLRAAGKDLGEAGRDPVYGYGALDMQAFILEEKGTLTLDMGTPELENEEIIFVHGHTLQEVPMPEREYLVFDDWYYDKGYTRVFAEEDYFTTPFYEDTTLYAKWVNEDAADTLYSYRLLPDGTAEITGYRGKRRHLDIPETVDGYTVTSIGQEAFAGNLRLRTVSLPSALTAIQDRAFMASGLVSVIQNDSHLTYIGSKAFRDCSRLTAYTVPDSVTHIGSHAFFGSRSLAFIRVGEGSALERIGEQAFAHTRISRFYVPERATLDGSVFCGCIRLKEVALHPDNPYYTLEGATLYTEDLSRLVYHPAALSGEVNLAKQTRVVGCYAFANSSAAAVTLNEGLQTLEEYAFVSSAVRSVSMPDSVTLLGSNTFEGSRLAEVRLSASLTDIPAFCFAGTRLRRIVLPESLTGIESGAFNMCSYLESVEMGSRVREIGAYAFARCVRLTAVPLPEGLESIEALAFQHAGLKAVTLPGSLRELGSAAFIECSSLEEVIIHAESPLAVLPEGCFEKCSALKTLRLPAGLVSIENRALYHCVCLETVDLNGNEVLRSIGAEAFKDTASLTEMSVPDSLTQLGELAFYGSGIRSFRIPASLTGFGSGALGKCVSLTELTVDEANPLYRGENNLLYTKDMTVLVCVPASRMGSFTVADTVKAIGERAFSGCMLLDRILLPEGLTEICIRAFEGCQALEEIEIPRHVVQIQRYAFDSCHNLQAVRFAKDCEIRRLGLYTFSGCGLREVTIPASVVFLSQGTFFHCARLETVRFEAGSQLTSLPARVFDGSLKLREILFGSSSSLRSLQAHALDGLVHLTRVELGGTELTSVGNFAFYNCPSLAECTLPEGVLSIGRRAFLGCASLSRLDLPASLEFIGGEAFANTNGIQLFFRSETLPRTEEGWNTGILNYYLGIRDLVSGDQWDYALSVRDEVSLLAYKGTDTELFIDKVDGYPVRALGGLLFENSVSPVSVTLGASVAEVGDYAFLGCEDLTRVALSPAVKRIGMFAFAGTAAEVRLDEAAALEEIGAFAFYMNTGTVATALPNGVVSIGEAAFAESAISTLEIGADSALREIGERAFAASDLTAVYLPAALATVGDEAFAKTASLREVEFGEGEVPLQIGHNSFRESGIIRVAIPARVYYIGEFAFAECGFLEDISVTEGNPSYCSFEGMLFNVDRSTLIRYPGGRRGEIVIPNEVEVVTYGAFMGAEHITAVTFEEGSRLRTLGWQSFSNCTSLVSITLPPSLKSMEYYTFANCTSLQRVSFAEGSELALLGDFVFYNCTSLRDITVPGSLTYISQGTFYNCTSLSTFPLGDLSGLETVSDYAFYGCTSLEELPYMPSLLMVGIQAFARTGVEEVMLPATLEAIDDTAFLFGEMERILVDEGNPCYVSVDGVLMDHGSTSTSQFADVFIWPAKKPLWFGQGLETVYAPDIDCITHFVIEDLRFADSVRSIGPQAFTGIDNVYGVTVGNNVEYVAGGAFALCENLRSVTLADNLKTLAPYAFFGNFLLERIHFNAVSMDDIPTDENGVFLGCGLATDGIRVVFGNEARRIPARLFFSTGLAYEQPYLTVIEFEPESQCAEVGKYAFANCAALKVVYWAPKAGAFTTYFSQWATTYFPEVMAYAEEYSSEVEATQTYPYVGEVVYNGVSYRYKSKHDCELSYTEHLVPVVPCERDGTDLYTCACGLMHHESVFRHSEGDWIVDREPWCMEYGSKHTECVDCQTRINESFIPYLSHDWGEEHPYKAPTCTEMGWFAYRECGRCHSYQHGTTAKDPFIAPTGHAFTDWRREVAPTCEAEGLEVRFCVRCQGEREERSIPKREHDWSTAYTYQVRPTCTQPGIRYFPCNYSDCDAGIGYTEAPAKGHQMVFDGILTAPTCTEEGLDRIRCSACGEEGTQARPARGHYLFTYDENPATCVSPGHNAYEMCSRCDYTTYEEYPALSHDFGEWAVAVEPTCTEIGVNRRICSRCGRADEEVIPAAGHSLTIHEALAPTCTEAGHNAYEVCGVCGHTTYEELQPTGHPFGEWVVDVAPGIGVAGHRYRPCSVCGVTLEEETLAPTGDLTDFESLVLAAERDGTVTERYTALSQAISAYRNLNPEEREAAASLYTRLRASAEAYNRGVKEINDCHHTIVRAVTGSKTAGMGFTAALPPMDLAALCGNTSWKRRKKT